MVRVTDFLALLPRGGSGAYRFLRHLLGRPHRAVSGGHRHEARGRRRIRLFQSNHEKAVRAIALLHTPGPLFIESGTLDAAAYFKDSFIAFTRSREFYRRLGAGDRIRFGLFRGVHLIHGTKAFPFLDRWLKP
jgi:hypothetical protein